MMKRLYKIISIFILILIIVSSICSTQAADIADTNPWEQAKDFLQTGATTTGMLQEGDKQVGAAKDFINRVFGDFFNVLGINGFQKNFMNVIDFLWGIGLLVIFVSTVILGIKYMMVLPQEKSRVKQALTPYIIGTVIIFGAVTIWRIIIKILESAL